MENGNGASLAAKRLEGKVVMITGGAGGIGEATVKLFISHGAKVVIADVTDDKGKAIVNSLAPHSVTYIHCDITKEEEMKNLVDSTISLYGKLDIFFNNAAILGHPKNNSILGTDMNEYDRIMCVNVRGTALGTKHAARAMIPRKTGCIISTASVAGVIGGTSGLAYTTSKHAIIGIMKNASCELGKYGIRVNCISPFGVATPMLTNSRKNAGEPHDEIVEHTEEYVRGLSVLKGVTLKAQDIAEAALFLASDESRYINGHNLIVDGGFTTSKKIAKL